MAPAELNTGTSDGTDRSSATMTSGSTGQDRLRREITLYSLRGALAAALLGAITAFALNLNRSYVPMVGDRRAFGTVAVLLSSAFTLVAAGISFAVGMRYRNERVTADRRHDWRLSVAPVALGVAVETLFLIGVGIILANATFKDLALINVIASSIVGAVCAVTVYRTVGQFLLTNERTILQVVVVLLLFGLVLAATQEQNTRWWEESFSYLGTADSNTQLFFNISFVLSGLLLVVWQQFFMEKITILVDHNVVRTRIHNLIKLALILIGVLVTVIGILHWGESPLITTIHDLSAYGAGTIITLGMLTVYWLIPRLSREFYVTSVLLAVLGMAAVGMLFLGIFNTVGVELVYFTIAGGWLILLTNDTEMLINNIEPNGIRANAI